MHSADNFVTLNEKTTDFHFIYLPNTLKCICNNTN